MIHHGDCIDVMATLDAESVDAIVTDPPYGLGFMGKDWDSPGGLGDFPMRRTTAANTVNTGLSRQGGRQRSTEAFAKRQRRDMLAYQEQATRWFEAMHRVAKPGAHLLAFGGTRTYHRLAAAIEDAGWEIRDCLVWAYASGFPKSRNLDGEWQGWGTALKPAWEPIVMARKPLRGTVAANVERYGTGALNIDGTRIPLTGAEAVDGREGEATADARYTDAGGTNIAAKPGRRIGTARRNNGTALGMMNDDDWQPSAMETGGSPLGRWPANVVLTDPVFDGDTPGVVGGGETASGKMLPTVPTAGRAVYGQDAAAGWTTIETYGDTGTYSRFFLIPKADRADREPVLGGLPKRHSGGDREGELSGLDERLRTKTERANVHPTVKPTELMRHLVRLVTPPGGLVLDPFLGSGTTALACEMEGFGWVGIEREAEYVAIAEARLNGVQKGLGLSA